MRANVCVSVLLVFFTATSGSAGPAKPDRCGDKHPEYRCAYKIVPSTLASLATDAPSWQWFLEANDLPADTNPETTVPAETAYYLEPRMKFKLGHPSCESYETQKKAGVYCKALTEPGNFGEVAGRYGDFDWFKRMNDLPNNVSRSTPAPAYTLYIWSLRED